MRYWRAKKAVGTLIGLTFFINSATASAQTATSISEPSVSGSDITRPSHRIDLRVEFEQGEDEHSLTSTFRYEQPIALSQDWQVNFRADLPFVSSDEEGDPEELNKTGLGDVLLQAIFVRHVTEHRGFGVGAQFIMPTSSGDLGKGKWRFRPTAAYRWPASSISEGSYFQFLVRYDFSFAGDQDREKVRDLQLSPNLEIELPDATYVSIFPSADIRYNFVTDEFFMPVNLEIGKSWGPVVMSLEGGLGLIKGDQAPYDWKMEGRVGFRF